MFEFILFGSMVWFWILFGFWSLVVLFTVKLEQPGITAFVSFGFFVMFARWGVLPGGESLLGIIAANPGSTILIVVAFFVLGTIWAIVKWWFYIQRQAEKRRQELAKPSNYGTPIRKPLVIDNKSRIMTWMCFWPFSLIWTLVDDSIRGVFRFIYTKIRTKLQRMADKAFEGLENPESPSKPEGSD